MILSDYDINGMIQMKRLIIRPFYNDMVRENGIDMRLASEIAHHKDMGSDFVMDPMSSNEDIKKCFKIKRNVKEMVIASREQVLLTTSEYMEVPDDVAGFVELRSTWARHGLSMPPTIIDAGFKGTITLEVINNAPYAIKMRPKQRFAHIIFVKLQNKTGNTYAGFYKGQRGIKLPQVLK
ncbi:MAG: dCTP deaminase [Methanothrix sp.]